VMNKIEINKTKDAKELILSALKDEPNHEFVQFMAGKIFYLLKDYEQAKFCLIRSYEQNPDVETQNILGLTYFEMGDHESANSIFKNLIKKMGPNVNLLLNSAKCYEKTGDVESAKEQLNKLLGIFSDHEEAIEMLKQLS